MIREYESEMICDLAETYHVFNYRELPPKLTATLVSGLRANSRVKMSLTGMKIPVETTIQAMIYDAVSMILWMNSDDGRRNRNRPKSLVKTLMEDPEPKEFQTFSSGAEFLKKREEILQMIREEEDA